MQVKMKQLELDMEQQNGSKLEKEYIKAVYCHPAIMSAQGIKGHLGHNLSHAMRLSSEAGSGCLKSKNRAGSELGLGCLQMQMTPL